MEMHNIYYENLIIASQNADYSFFVGSIEIIFFLNISLCLIVIKDFIKKLVNLIFFILIILLCACVTTPYKGIPANQLTDAQLIEEIKYVYNELGISISNLNTAILTQPAPIYKIQADSFTNFSWNTNYFGNNSYSKGTANTTTNYKIYNANQLNQSIAELGIAMQQARIRELEKRKRELLAEYDKRVYQKEAEQREIQDAIMRFFNAHPSLRNEIPLLETIFPWVASNDYKLMLERLAYEAELVLYSRAAGKISGRWYGNIAINEKRKDSTKEPINSLIRGDVEEIENNLKMNLTFPNGEVINISGLLYNTIFQGAIYFYDKDNKLIFSEVINGLASNKEIRLLFEKKEDSENSINGILTLTR